MPRMLSRGLLLILVVVAVGTLALARPFRLCAASFSAGFARLPLVLVVAWIVIALQLRLILATLVLLVVLRKLLHSQPQHLALLVQP